MKQLCALVLCVVASTAAAEKKPYTLADLKSLVSQKSYKEAVAHLGDIAPAERKDEWMALAGEAAGGYIASLSNDDAITKIVEIERLDAEFPALLKSPRYAKARVEVGPDAFNHCFAARYYYDECREHAWKFLQADPANPELAFAMGKVMRRGTSTYWAALRFFRAAYKSKPTKAMCTDDDAQMAVLSGFATSKDNAAMPIAKEIATACWEYFKKPLVDEFDKDDSESFRTNACDYLKGKKALDAKQVKRCK